MVWQMNDRALSAPHLATTCLNWSRSSAMWMDSMRAPISSTSYFSSIPASARPIAALSAVWPPSVGRIASGRSFAMIASMISVVMGST